MTQRIRLDEHLAQQAAAAGADVRDGVKVTDVVADDVGASRCMSTAGRWRQTCSSERTASTARVRKSLGLGGDYVLGVALEANVANEVVGERVRGDRRARAGHHPRRLRLGLPEGRPRERRRRRLGERGPDSPRPAGRALQATRHRAESAVESIRGHRLPLRKPGSIAARGRALLVGDAAGLVDPLSGDGMYEAFVSARLASEAVLELLEGRVGCARLATRRRWRRRSGRSCLPRGARRSRSTATHARRSRSAARRSRGA